MYGAIFSFPEVRHRIQHGFPEFRLFRPESVIDPEKQSLIEIINGLSGEFTEKEFDAVVVGTLAVWDEPCSDEEIEKILLMQPEL